MVGKGMANPGPAPAAARIAANGEREGARCTQPTTNVLGREIVFPGAKTGRLASAGFGLACVTSKTSRFVRPASGLPDWARISAWSSAAIRSRRKNRIRCRCRMPPGIFASHLTVC
jgi:hypothetical protein